jgi:hypothetical protein
MNDRDLEKLLSTCSVRQVQLLNDDIPSDEELANIVPSEQFEREMQNLLNRKLTRNKHNRVQRFVASFAIIITIVFGTILSVDATRSSFLRFFERYFTVSINKNEQSNENFNNAALLDLHQVYLPTWIPEGFTAYSSKTGSTGCVVIYKHDANPKESIRFSQKKGFVTALNDNDLYGFTKIEVGRKTYYYGTKNTAGETQSNLVWIYNDTEFTINGVLGKESLVKIAESLKFKE